MTGQVGRGEALDDDADLDDISPDTLAFGLRKAFSQYFMAFGRIAVYADDTRLGPSEIDAPGHTNIDLGASWTPNRRIEIRGQLRNLLNQDYYASPDPRWVPAPGFNGVECTRSARFKVP